MLTSHVSLKNEEGSDLRLVLHIYLRKYLLNSMVDLNLEIQIIFSPSLL